MAKDGGPNAQREKGSTVKTQQQVRRMLQRTGWDLHRRDYEHTLEAFISTLLPSLGVDCVLDVGAYHGEYTKFLRTLQWRGPIVSFEPLAESCRVLNAAAADDPLWTVLPFRARR